MTRLQSRKRRESSQKYLKPGTSKAGKTFSRIFPRLGGSERHVSPPATNKLKVNALTEKAIRVEVIDFLRDRGGTCTLASMASALAESNKIKDAYAEEPGGLTNKLKQLLKRAGHIVRPHSHDVNLMMRYDVTIAFNSIMGQKGATSTTVDSWLKAKELFSNKLDFADEKENHGSLLEEEEGVRQNSRTLVKVDYDDVFDLLQTSIQKYREVTAIPMPEKISEQKDQDKDAYTKELERQYEEHELPKPPPKTFDDLERRMVEQEKEDEARKMASSLLREFTDKEEDIISSAVWGRGPGSEVVQSEGPDSVQRASMHKLQPGQWLNDEVIHYFYVMLGKRDEELCKLDANRKRSHFFKSFFMTKLLNEGHTDPAKDGQYEYKNVKRWSKKAPGKDIFKLDKVFFPINIGRMHWVCAVAFMQEKRIQFYDSMGAPGTEYLHHIFKYLQDEHQDKNKSPLPDLNKWKLVKCTSDTPRQGNGFDCGVFTCMFADFLSKDCPLLFTQEHVNQCRKRIALSISLGKAIL